MFSIKQDGDNYVTVITPDGRSYMVQLDTMISFLADAVALTGNMTVRNRQREANARDMRLAVKRGEKLTAIKLLRDTFRDREGRALDLKQAKDIIEAFAGID